MIRLLLATPLIALAACSSGGTPVSEATALNSPAAMMDMPRPDGRSFDVHAVPLPPGSTMADMSIMAHNATDDMQLAFTSPGAPAAVQAWFGDALPRAGYKVAVQGAGFAGTDRAGKMFRLDLTPGAGGTTTGTITAGG